MGNTSRVLCGRKYNDPRGFPVIEEWYENLSITQVDYKYMDPDILLNAIDRDSIKEAMNSEEYYLSMVETLRMRNTLHLFFNPELMEDI